MSAPHSASSQASTGITLPVLLAVWLLALAAGLGGLELYALTPSTAGAPHATWPASEPAGDAGRRTLVLFLHPQCSCSRATLSELALITAGTRGELSARVYVVLPPGAPAGWARSSLSRLAAENPDVRIGIDTGARVAQQFGAQTSGETFVYSPDGKLEFHGGITAARGHAGPNLGRSTVIGLAHTGFAPVATTPVFGCELLDELCTGRIEDCRP